MKRPVLTLTLLAAALMYGAPAFAQATLQPAQGGGLMPRVDAGAGTPVADESDTHPALSLTPDKSEMLHLDRDAGTIIVGNPAHLSAILDSSRTILLVPRAPGSTMFTVLDSQRKVIMQRHVFVDAPADKYIRIRRNCALGRGGCQPTSVYYCPDICHEISVQQASTGAPVTQTDVASGAPAPAPAPASGMPPAPTGLSNQPAAPEPEPAAEESYEPEAVPEDPGAGDTAGSAGQ